jgi:hypothetical protein
MTVREGLRYLERRFADGGHVVLSHLVANVFNDLGERASLDELHHHPQRAADDVAVG